MTLHELTNEWRVIQDMIDAADGEVTPEVEERLTAFEQAMPQKVDGYCRLITNLELQAATIAEAAKPFDLEAKRIRSHAKAKETAAERLRLRLKQELEAQGQTTVRTDLFTVSVAKLAPALSWRGDQDDPPKQFTRTVTALDTDAVKKWYSENGWLPDGFAVDARTSLRIK